MNTATTRVARAIARNYSRSVEAFTDILKQYQREATDRLGVEAALAKTADDITRDNPEIPDVDTFITMALSEAAAGQLNQGIRDLGFTASSFPQWDRGITEHLAEQFANPDSTASMCATLRTEWLIIPLNVADIVANQWAAPNRPDNALEPFPLVGNGTGPSTKNLSERYEAAYHVYADAFSDAVRANADGIVHDPVKIYVTAETAANQMERDPNAYHTNPEVIGGYRFTPDMLATYLWEQAHEHLAPPRLAAG